MKQAPESRAFRAPAALLPYQQRWVADRSPVKICEKSRRVGISWASAAEAALTASDRAGQDVWYVGYNKDMSEEFIRDVADWTAHFTKVAVKVEEELVEDDGKEILTFVIRFASGYRVTALSSRPSNLRGKQGLVILDEAAFHSELKELLKAAIALLMWGGRVAVISTHDGVDNTFNELILEVRAGKKPYSLHHITLDDALADGLFRRICLRTGRPWSADGEAAWRQSLVEFYGDAAEEELFCVPSSSGGAYLPTHLIEARMYDAPVLRFAVDDAFVHRSDAERTAVALDWCEAHLGPLLAALDTHQQHAFGLDFGRDCDLTVIAPVAITPELRRVVPCLVELRNMPFRQQEQILFYLADRLPRLVGGALDGRGNGQFLAEFASQRYGAYRIQEVMLSDKWYLEHMPRFRAALEDAHLDIPRDADVRADLRALQVVRGVPKLTDKKSKGADGKQRHGDAAIALVLAHAASSIDAVPIEYLSAGKRESVSLGFHSARAANWRDD